MGAGTVIPLGDPALTGTCYNAENVSRQESGVGRRREERRQGNKDVGQKDESGNHLII